MKYYWFAPRRSGQRPRHGVAHRLHRRGRLRNIRPAAAGRHASGRPCSNPAERRRDPVRPGRARHPSSRSGDAPPRQRHRRDDDRRSKRTSAGSSAGRRTTSSAPPRSAGRRPPAPRGRSSASRWSTAASRRHGYDAYVGGDKGRRRHERHADAVPEESHRHGVSAGRARGRPAPSSTSTSAAAARARASSRCRSTRRARREGAMMAYPAGFKYTKDHEWIELAGDRGKVGITDYAQQQLGDVVYIELPEVGAKLKQGQSFGTIESVKAVSELYSPVTGEIVEVNTALKDKPEDRQHGPARQLDGRHQADRTRRSRRAPRRRAVSGRCQVDHHRACLVRLRRNRFPVPPHRTRRGTKPTRCSKVVGAPSLDALIDEAIPAPHPARQAAEPARRAERTSIPAASCATVAARNQMLRSFIGLGYYDTDHAERHPAQRARESRLVHAVHAVPGRDRAGPPRIAPQFPDDGARPDRDGGRQRVAARRSHRRRRSDDDAGAGAGEADRRHRGAPAVPRRRLVLPADDRGRCESRAEPLGIEVVVAPIERSDDVRRSRVRRARPDAGRSGRVHDLREFIARAKRAGVARRRRHAICSASRC